MAYYLQKDNFPHFRTVNNSPSRISDYGHAQTAVNAMTIANQSSWEAEFKGLLREVHTLCLMPDNKKCVYAFFAANHFFRQPGKKQRVTVRDVIHYMNAHCTDGQQAILCILNSSEYIALVPEASAAADPTESGPYKACGFRPFYDAEVADIWIRWVDHQDHSPKKRRTRTSPPKTKPQTPLQDHNVFHYHQQNPKNSTGDCVIRAVASTCGISWGDAVDGIASASHYVNTTLNTEPIFRRFLEQEGFVYHPPLKNGGRKLSAKGFCDAMGRTYSHGERIFAFLGASHVAAVLPFDVNGTRQYKVEDSWDSTGRLVGGYWVKPIPDHTPKEDWHALEGAQMIHPIFGFGHILTVHDGGWMDVHFTQNGLRALENKWVKQNCKILLSEKEAVTNH